MSNTQIALLSIAGVVAAVLLIVLVVIPELKKKNVNIEKIVKSLESKGEIVEKAADELKPLLPKKAVTILDILEKWCPIGAGYAEQLAHTGDIDKEDRAAVAIDTVLDVLKELDIDVTDRRKSLIKATIENAVNDLGHEKPVGKLTYNVDIKPNGITQIKEDNNSITSTVESKDSKSEITSDNNGAVQIKVGEVKKDENNNIVSVDSDGKETPTQIKAENAIGNIVVAQSTGEAEKVVAEATQQQAESPKTVEDRVTDLEGQINQISTNLTNIVAAIAPTNK